MDRLACVNVAALPLQLLLRAHPDWRGWPAAVIDADKPQGLVLYVNAPAYEKGVRSGHRYATALSIARDLRAGTVPRSQIARDVQALTDRLRRFSPHVEPASDRPGVFWLDAHGLGRLYPSLDPWAQEIRADLERVSLTSTVAVAFSRFGAFALAISHEPRRHEDTKKDKGLPIFVSSCLRGSSHVIVCVDPADEQARVDRVPLARIDLNPDVRDRLLALGVTTVGGFLRLPAGGIRARFGAETDALYQLAAGHRWAPLVPVALDEPHTASVDFDFPESNVDRLIFVIKRLLDGLATAIARQVRTIAGASLQLTLDNRERRTEHVRPAAATLDVAQILMLIHLRLEALQLPSGIVTLEITADTSAASAAERRLFPEYSQRDADAANQAFARLRAECGELSVARARLCDAHLPGAQFAWEPLERVPVRSTPRVVATRPLVRRIFEHAIPLANHKGPRHGMSESGPYVLSGAWWGAHAVQREYFFVRTDTGELQWIYYDRRRQRFFLQGYVE